MHVTDINGPASGSLGRMDKTVPSKGPKQYRVVMAPPCTRAIGDAKRSFGYIRRGHLRSSVTGSWREVVPGYLGEGNGNPLTSLT